jgi:phosphate transport system permease protein
MIILLSGMVIVPLFLILFFIIKNGFSVINWGFLVHLPRPVGEAGGGISNAIVGSLILIMIASVLAIPIGVMAGVYLAENKTGQYAQLVRILVEILQGTPSIVLGMIAWIWVVVKMGGFSALSGGVALAMMMLPIIVRSTEETVKLIPNSLKEASLALGASYFRTIIMVILPSGLSGIITGMMISISRIAGESAPLLFTAFGSQYMNTNIFKPVSSLPLIIFTYASSPYNDWINAAWGASAVLVTLVVGLNIIAKVVINKWKVQF